MSTEGYSEKKKLLKLRLALSKALDNSISVCTREKVSFPSLNPTALDKPREQIIEYLTTNCKQEFEDILSRHGIIDKLASLDSLKLLPEPLKPLDAARASVIKAKQQELEKLDSILEFYHVENSSIKDNLLQKRQLMNETMDFIQNFSIEQKENAEKLECCL